MHADFFFEIPRFEEVLDSNSSTHREEVGRPTLRASGGFLTAFFYQIKFRVFTQQILLVYRRPSKTATNKPLNTSGVEESERNNSGQFEK